MKDAELTVIKKMSIDAEASHILEAKEVKLNGSLYALDPCLVHKPGTHPNFREKGWYKVVIGKRGKFHDFAAPTID